MSTILCLPPFTLAECHITHGADWVDSLPQFREGSRPSDLTGVTVEIFIRPAYDHPVLLKKLSTADGTMVIDDAAYGLISTRVDRATVAAELPIGEWSMLCIQTDPHLGAPGNVLERERFRGALFVHPGRVTG